MPPSAWQSMWHSCRDKRSTSLSHYTVCHLFFHLRCRSQPYPRPVAEGQHQGGQSGLQFSQGGQVIGGETGDVVTCTHFTQEATVEKKDISKWRHGFQKSIRKRCAMFKKHYQRSPGHVVTKHSRNFGVKI